MNEGAQMSSELESARATVVNLELLEPMVLVQWPLLLCDRDRVAKLDELAQSRSEDHASGHLDCTFPA